jgi:hypothetical protein
MVRRVRRRCLRVAPDRGLYRHYNTGAKLMPEYKAMYIEACNSGAQLSNEILYLKKDKDILYQKIDDLHAALREIIRLSNNGTVIATATKAIEDTKCYTLSQQYSLPL